MVLVVDADPRGFEDIERMLGSNHVWFARSAEDARTLLSTVGDSFTVALIDRELPENEAFRLIAELHDRRPEIAVMVMVSPTDTSVNGHTNVGAVGLLRKPVTRAWRDAITDARAAGGNTSS